MIIKYIVGVAGFLIWLVAWVALIDCIWNDRLGKWANDRSE